MKFAVLEPVNAASLFKRGTKVSKLVAAILSEEPIMLILTIHQPQQQ